MLGSRSTSEEMSQLQKPVIEGNAGITSVLERNENAVPLLEYIYAGPRSRPRSRRQAPSILDIQRVPYPYAQSVWCCVPALSQISHFLLVTVNIKEAFSEIWILFQQLGIEKPIISSFPMYLNEIIFSL